MPTLKSWGNRELQKLRQDMDKMFDAFCFDLGLPSLDAPVSRTRAGLSIQEEDDHFVVSAHMPDLSPNDIDITVSGNTLTIKGKLIETTSQSTRTRIVSRKLNLACEVDPDKVTATYKDGMLTIHLPHCPRPTGRTIRPLGE